MINPLVDFLIGFLLGAWAFGNLWTAILAGIGAVVFGWVISRPCRF